MKRAFFYHPETGAIQSAASVTGAVPEEEYSAPTGLSLVIQDCPGEINDLVVDLHTGFVVECAEMSLVYPNGTVALADGIAEIVVTGLPVGTQVIARLPEGQVAEVVDDGVIELRSLLPGQGYLTFYHPLYKPIHQVEIRFL